MTQPVCASRSICEAVAQSCQLPAEPEAASCTPYNASCGAIEKGKKHIKTIIIFREELLLPSETFIAAQVNALRRTKPIYVGLIPAKNSLPIEQQAVLMSDRTFLPKRYYKLPYHVLGIAPNFHRRVAALNAQIFHAHFAIDATTAMPLISRLGIPAIVTLHGYDVTTRDREFCKTAAGSHYLRHRERMWDKVSVFLCVSKFIRDAAKQSGFPEEKLRVHYIGVNRQEFAPSDQPREPLVLFVGRLVEKKGCGELLQAMKLVQEQSPQIELVIVGFGPLRQAIEAQAKELGIRYSFLGRQPASVVRDMLGRCRVLCVPSFTAANGDSEGLPTVVMEAHAMGVPVVGYRHAGIPEVVVHKETGLLSEEHDIPSLAQGILCYLEDESFWKSSSLAAQKRVEEHFDLAKQTAVLETAYDEL
jgi:glycosyltransferase involved in cell wall biosynthesis